MIDDHVHKERISYFSRKPDASKGDKTMEDHQLDIRYAIQVKHHVKRVVAVWGDIEHLDSTEQFVLKRLEELRALHPKNEYRLIRVNPPPPALGLGQKEKAR